LHPALYCWREEIPATLVRMLAYAGGAAVLSIAAAHFFQAPTLRGPAGAVEQSQWVGIARPFPAFALSIPEAADAPASYTIRYNRLGGGRKDILSLGEPDSAAPYLNVEIYRAGGEITRFAPALGEIAAEAAALGPTELREAPPLASKFGPLTVVTFATSKGTPRKCLGFVRTYDEPLLQLSGWFCRGGEFIERSTLSCALDRLTLLGAGSEPKVGALFAKAELNRSYCVERDPIIAATPKFTLLWKAAASRPEPRRIGR
jgi:hypothetical protein